jgi:hypothetical protein
MKEEQSFWAFQPVADPPLPAVKDTAWVQSPLDRFILRELEKKGLRPVAPADKRTLLRRATFDLIGLPPSPAEMDAFLADATPEALAKVVDRLLASPHYGERWARHWLDVARYADSNGMDENLAYANAFRYRDYLVAAFNKDKPYDLLIREQLAGDLLPTTGDASTSQDRVLATGFLAIGPKMLAEDDPVKMEMDIVDEQIDTVGRAFMGLTLGCARCHDHKFDPIRMQDYYALAGIFKSTKTMENFKVVARWYERPLGTPAENEGLQAHDRKIASARSELEKRVQQVNKPSALELKRFQERLAALEKSRPSLPEAMGVTEGKAGNTRVHIRGSHWTLGKEVPRRFLQIVNHPKSVAIDGSQSGRRQLAEWLTQPEHPLTSRVMVNRIWRWLFGDGLVRTPDNFGMLGERPVNQPLLDWLAVRFVESGWSIKAMHRLIMLSSTYQMSTTFDERAAQTDPENRLHWRMNRRRLEAEALRDALLALGGHLDPGMGGSLLNGKNREYVTSTANRNYDQYDSRRRSLYLPVIRSALYDVFQAFDFPDPCVPNGDRATTTVASQALFMMNSKVLLEETRELARKLLADRQIDDVRVRKAYERIFGRLPTAGETERALQFIGDAEKMLAIEKATREEVRLSAWQGFCRVLVSSNEFVYVE